ncbi:rhomboid family intramembrane serine protease [Niabella beijingensis]|uniref:rhomboid family intramembrane serine protease n=1 Tax=Niabella beijingensis TaxID=2872700 RepID=UPI001CBE4EFC|nr:rhomboid family intramembrane serine protease [Niabella beijingensis]MBZ4192375.1 rhomboid family intramembrane serine protease [Niabella beijingensis]
MMPIGDDNTGRTLTPYVNYLLIALNIFVFVYYQRFGTNIDFLLRFSTVPGEILTGQDIAGPNDLEVTPVPVYATILTSMFMHGSIAHIFGNMLYLSIFGDNIENAMGHFRYLVFYLLCGVLASCSHVLMSFILDDGLLVPSLGASGAISGVLGGYLVMFPRNKVRIWALLFSFNVPAVITLGIWIVMQIVSQVNTIGGREQSGVAYAAHIGGFLAGMLLVRFFANKRPTAVNRYPF